MTDMIPDRLKYEASRVVAQCREAGFRLAVAESCTGGLVAGCMTAVPGASEVLERGFVTYANQAKVEMLDVPPALIEACGAVSEAVAMAMAEGALAHSAADIGVALTGIAGPGGGSEAKPVGLVHIACVCKGRPPLHERHVFPGDRESVRMQAVEAALRLIRKQAAGPLSSP